MLSLFTYRLARPEDETILWEMLYHAIYTPPGDTPPPRETVKQPQIAIYVAGWGKPDDLGLIAVESSTKKAAGAAWLRLFSAEDKGFGYVNNETPELSIALLPEYRGQGIGTQLLTRLLDIAKDKFPAVSLSVVEGNPAVNFYRRLGFEEVKRSKDALTMVKRLAANL